MKRETVDPHRRVLYRLAKLVHRENIAWLVLAISLGITYVVWQLSAYYVHERGLDRFRFDVEDARQRIAQRMLDYEQVLRGGVALFETHGGMVGRVAWRQYVASLDLQRHSPGMRGMGYSLMLRGDELAGHVAAVRAEGFPNYQLTPAGARDLYSSVIYLEPFDEFNQRAFGYDMFSESVRRAAMERARDSGVAALSGPVSLVQEPEDSPQRGFLMYLPVYRPGPPPHTVEARREALLGFVYAPFRTQDLMRGILGQGPSGLGFTLIDRDSGEPLYESDPIVSSPEGRPSFAATTQLSLPGRDWDARFHSRPEFDDAVHSYEPQVLAFGGLVVNALLFMSIMSLVGEKKRVRSKVREITAELRTSHRRLQLARDSAELGIWDLGLADNSLIWDERMFELFDVPPEAFDGTYESWRRAVYPDDLARVEQELQQAVAGIKPFNTAFRVLHRNGVVRVLEVQAVILRDADGNANRAIGVNRDVTERVAVERALRQSEYLLKESEQITGLGSWRWDLATDQCWWSDGYYRLLGIATSEPSNFDNFRTRLPAKDLASFTATMERVRNTGEPAALEHVVLPRDGEERIVSVRLRPILDDEQKVSGFFGTALDITARKRAEQALAAEHSLLQSIIDAIPDFVVLKDTQLTYQAVNSAFLAFIDKPLDTILGNSDFELFETAVAEQNRADERTVLTTGLPLTRESRLVKAGAEHWVQTALVPLPNSDGGTAGVLMSTRDITVLKRAEQNLRRRHAELEAVFATTHVHVAVLDREYRFLRTNEAYAAHLGDTSERLVGRNYFDLCSDDDLALFEQVMSTRQPLAMLAKPSDYLGRGITHWDWTLSPLKEEGEWVNGLVLTLIDASEREQRRQEAEDAWRRANTQLERRVRERTREWEAANYKLGVANRELESFSYSVAHDLYGPLRAINGFSQILSEDYGPRLDAAGHGYLTRIEEATLRMSQLIDGLLNLSQIFRSELQPVALNLSTLAMDVARSLQLTEPSRMVDFEIQPGVRAVADSTLLRVLLQNLLGNAWKFSARQDRAIIAFGKHELEGRSVFFVRDNGVGFEMEYAHKLFQPFERLHADDEFQGTGIGLATARRVIQRHGGQVWAEGAPGVGATFFFTLPDATDRLADLMSDPRHG